jgi:peptidyl-prolyl cis-trans isomerase SDCCAG10
MSTQYNIEPLPTGRVLVKTSMGPLDVELFAKETPQTCRSFIQLCLEGYYNNAIFHRVVKDFIIQTGDPTGTGTGGEAATDEGVVKDEFHSRLRYNRRGLVGMANSGEKDDNGSQFFITLSATPELERRNTLFGRLATGDTIFNALRIGDLETDKLDRPVHPPRIISVEVIENPFSDIVPRSTEEERQERQRQLEAEKIKSVVKKAKKRNKALLSFGDEEGEDGSETIKTKIKSVYDLDGPPSEPSKATANRPVKPNKEPASSVSMKQKAPSQTIDLTDSTPVASYAAAVPIVVDDSPSPPPVAAPKKPPPPVESVEDQIASLKSQLKGLKNKRVVEEVDEEPSSKRGKNFLDTEISRYMSSGRVILGKRSRKTRREDDTLSKLTQFQKKILGVPVAVEAPAPVEEEELEACELHNVPGCMSCFDRYGEQPDEDDPKSLWGHKLTFAKDLFGKDEKYRTQRQGEDLEVIDPRERAKDFAEQEKRNRGAPKSTKVWRQAGQDSRPK